MAPSMVVLLNTPLILLPMRLIPKDSPLFDVLLQEGPPGLARRYLEERRKTVQMRIVLAKQEKKRGGGHAAFEEWQKRRGL